MDSEMHTFANQLSLSGLDPALLQSAYEARKPVLLLQTGKQTRSPGIQPTMNNTLPDFQEVFGEYKSQVEDEEPQFFHFGKRFPVMELILNQNLSGSRTGLDGTFIKSKSDHEINLNQEAESKFQSYSRFSERRKNRSNYEDIKTKASSNIDDEGEEKESDQEHTYELEVQSGKYKTQHIITCRNLKTFREKIGGELKLKCKFGFELYIDKERGQTFSLTLDLIPLISIKQLMKSHKNYLRLKQGLPTGEVVAKPMKKKYY